MDPQTATIIVGIASPIISAAAALGGAWWGGRITARVTKESQDRKLLIEEWNRTIELDGKISKMQRLLAEDDIEGLEPLMEDFHLSVSNHLLSSVASQLYSEYDQLKTSDTDVAACFSLLQAAKSHDARLRHSQPRNESEKKVIRESMANFSSTEIREKLEDLPEIIGTQEIYPKIKTTTGMCLEECRLATLVVNALFRKLLSTEMPYGYHKINRGESNGMFTPAPITQLDAE